MAQYTVQLVLASDTPGPIYMPWAASKPLSSLSILFGVLVMYDFMTAMQCSVPQNVHIVRVLSHALCLILLVSVLLASRHD